MKRPAEYLDEAAKYDDLVARAPNERRKSELKKLAEIYRYLAQEAALLTKRDRSDVDGTDARQCESTERPPEKC